MYREIAEGYFKKGYNCAQSVILAFCPHYGLDEQTALKLSLGFGAGMGRLREVCGAVSAAFMVMGLEYGGRVTKARMYELQQIFAQKWKDANGSIICRDLLNLQEGKSSFVPEERTKEYYKKRPCAELVAFTADLLEDFISQFKE